MKAEAYLMPLTLCSGMIEGAEQWDSYKALRKAMKSGKARDARAVGAAIMKDMSDPQKAKAFTEGIKKAEIGMRAAEILRRDKGKLMQMMNEAGKAFKEAKEAKKRKNEVLTTWNIDYQRHLEAVNQICAGADEEALKAIEETSKAIAQHRKDLEKYGKKYEESKATADELYQKALSMATGQAKREMLEEAERKRTRRQTMNEEEKKPKEPESNEAETTEMPRKEEEKNEETPVETSEKSEE